MPLTLEERSSNLEMEVNTTKDTIWRLTNRVCVLESEFKRFKDLLKRSVMTAPSLHSPPKSTAKQAEMARRVRQEVKIKNNAVKEEILSESSGNEMSMDYADMSGLGAGDVVEGSQSSMYMDEGTNYASFEDIEDFDPTSASNDSDEDYKAPIRIKSPGDLFDRKKRTGRKKSSIWTDFKRMDVFKENGHKSVVTICKHCKRAVSSRGVRLRQHLKKCSMYCKVNIKSETLPTPKNTIDDDDALNYVESDDASDSDVNYEAIAAEAASLNPSKSGRKRTPIWRHFIRKPKPATPGRPTRKYSVIAICKNCKVEVSAKAGRMTRHLQKCLSGNNSGTIRTPKKNKVINNSTLSSNPDTANVSHSTINLVNPFETATPSASKEISESINVANWNDSTAIADNCDNTTTETTLNLSNCDGNSIGKAYNVESSAVESESSAAELISNKASNVWRHYNVTKVLKEGKICVSSASCKYCGKIVSPKSGRLSMHLEKCMEYIGAMTIQPESNSAPKHIETNIINSTIPLATN